MNTLKKIGALLFASGVLAAAGPALAQSAAAPSAQITKGQDLWDKNGCYQCHGTVGQGGVGPAVAVDLVPFAAVSVYVRHPTGEMPPFSEKVLSDADLRDIYAYLGSLPQPKSPDSTPLLPKPVVGGGK
jgi:ubiquinol-cytochrome c reductase cytochrome c subunit